MEQFEQQTACLASAMRLLAMREHSVAELTRKLESKGFSGALIETVISDLTAQNLQSDWRYAEQVIHSRQRKGYGPVYVQAYLRDKGVNSRVMETMLDFQDAAWQKALSQTVKKKFGEQIPKHYSEKAKQMNFLQRRGFTSDQIRQYYDQVDEVI